MGAYQQNKGVQVTAYSSRGCLDPSFIRSRRPPFGFNRKKVRGDGHPDLYGQFYSPCMAYAASRDEDTGFNAGVS